MLPEHFLINEPYCNLHVFRDLKIFYWPFYFAGKKSATRDGGWGEGTSDAQARQLLLNVNKFSDLSAPTFCLYQVTYPGFLWVLYSLRTKFKRPKSLSQVYIFTTFRKMKINLLIYCACTNVPSTSLAVF